jgi:hypothetical protein
MPAAARCALRCWVMASGDAASTSKSLTTMTTTTTMTRRRRMTTTMTMTAGASRPSSASAWQSSQQEQQAEAPKATTQRACHDQRSRSWRVQGQVHLLVQPLVLVQVQVQVQVQVPQQMHEQVQGQTPSLPLTLLRSDESSRRLTCHGFASQAARRDRRRWAWQERCRHPTAARQSQRRGQRSAAAVSSQQQS